MPTVWTSASASGRSGRRRTTSGALFGTDTYLCMFNAERVGVSPPISLEDYVRLPHVLTSLRKGERGVVDEALASSGCARTVALTTPRFVAVPFLVAGAPVVTTMHAKLARYLRRRARAQPEPGAGGAAGGIAVAWSGTPPTITTRRISGCAAP